MSGFLSRFIGFLIFLFVICIVLIALLPTIVSTDWGRTQTIRLINHSIPGSVEIRHLNLHWGQGQTLEGVLLKDPEGKTVLEIDKFSTEATLWKLISKSTHLGLTQIQELNATIISNEAGQTNLQKALGVHSTSAPHPQVPSTVILSHVNVESYLFVPNHPLSAQIKGFTEQNGLKGSFAANIVLNGVWSSSWEGLKQDAQRYLTIEGSKEAKIQAKVVNFPVDLIDHLVALQNPRLNGVFHSLLGDRLNLNLDKESSSDGLAFNLTLLAPLMQGNVKGLIKKDILSLKEPAIFHFNLTPESINPFTQGQIELLNPSRLEATISELMLPLNFFGDEAIDLCLFGFNSELKLPETDLHVQSIGNLKILSLQARLSSPPCDKFVQVAVIGKAQQDQSPFDFHFTSSLNKPHHFSQFVEQMQHNMHSTLTVSHFPLQMISLFREHPDWNEKLGPYLDAQLEIQSKDRENWTGTFSFQTPHFVLKEAQLNIGKDITLNSPAQFYWSLSPDCLRTLLNREELSLNQSCSLNLVLKQFRLPVNNPQLTQFQLESFISRLQFPKLVTGGIAQFDDLSFKIEGASLNQLDSNITGRLSLLTPDGKPSSLVPEPLIFKHTSNWKREKDELEMAAGQLQIDNSITHVQLHAHLHPNYLFEITQPAQIQYTFSPAAFQELSHLLNKEWPALEEPASLKLSIEPTEIDLKSFSLSNLYLQGLLEAKKIVLHEPSGDFPILEDVIVPWVLDAPRNNIYTNIKGLAYTKKSAKPSSISAHLQFWLQPGSYDPLNARSEIRMNFTGVPTSFATILWGLPDLNPIVGPIIDLNLTSYFDLATEKPGYWNIVLNSTNFHVEGRFKLNGSVDLYDLNKHPTFRLTINPESYEYLKKLLAFQDERKLAAPFAVTGTLSKIHFPLKDWADKGLFDFQLSTTDIQWQNSSAPAWKLESRLFSDNLKQRVNFLAQINTKTPLVIEGFVAHLFDQQNRLQDWKEMGLQAKLNGQQLTPTLLQNLLPITTDQRQKLHAILGETFDVQAFFQLQSLTGPLQVSAKGPLGYLQLDGQLKKGVLTLNKPLEASVKMTPLFSQAFFARNVPFLSTAIGSENPMTFTIEPSQFSCPLVPFQLDQVKIGKGNLNLGKLQFRNEGELKSILSLIKPLSDPYLTIWFTPIYLELNQGVLSLKRFDMLIAHTYTLANWGSINLMTHKANFVLGLPPQALQYAFGIQGLDENYILQIPFYSANGKVEIDKKKATARISSLVAQTQGGSKGKLLGSILDIALSEKGEPYPPPTTQPFPWQAEFDSSPKQEAKPEQAPPEPTPSSETESTDKKDKKKKKRKSLDNDNLKDLQDGAKQLLDQWLSH